MKNMMEDGCRDDGLNAFRGKVDAFLSAPLTNAWIPRARVYHYRSFGHLNFYDTLMVDPDSSRCFLVELVIRFSDDPDAFDDVESRHRSVTSAKDIRIGDVVELISGEMDEKLPKPPCHFTVRVSEMRITEPWNDMFAEAASQGVQGQSSLPMAGVASKIRKKPCNHQASKYGFHRPIFHDGIDQSWFDELDRMTEQKGEEKRKQKREAKRAAKAQKEGSDLSLEQEADPEEEQLCKELGATDEELDFLRSLIEARALSSPAPVGSFL